jgi:hypothetical protein
VTESARTVLARNVHMCLDRLLEDTGGWRDEVIGVCRGLLGVTGPLDEATPRSTQLHAFVDRIAVECPPHALEALDGHCRALLTFMTGDLSLLRPEEWAAVRAHFQQVVGEVDARSAEQRQQGITTGRQLVDQGAATGALLAEGRLGGSTNR